MARAHPDIAGLQDWQPLARGGFSTVWQARQESLDRLVAVKVDHRPLNEDKERRRFLREAGAAGRLSGHPGIVTVHDAGILPDGRPYLVMDLCPGGSLTSWLKPPGRQSEQRIRDMGVRIADALAAAHSRGVLHRDVKPANILIDSFDNPGLADFGLAALPEPGVEPSVTLEGMTPAYAPTEVFYLKPPTEFGDVYSLAATMYALMDGKPPRWPDLGTPSLPELLELHREPIERLPQVDDDFMDVLLVALDDEPERRPTAAEFRDQLAELTLSSTPSVSPRAAATPAATAGAPSAGATDDTSGRAGNPGSVDGPDSRAPLDDKRRRWTLALVAAAVVVTLVVIGWFSFSGRSRTAVPVPAAQPTVAGTSSAASEPEPEPTTPNATKPASSPPPEGFIDCSAALGGKSYCVDPAEPECWTNYFSYAGVLAIADLVTCDGYHEKQTFAAGELSRPVSRQSQLVARQEVEQLCNKRTLNKLLGSGKVMKDWDFQALPPQVQIEGDNLFRCLVGLGAQTEPMKLKVPKR